MKINIFSTALIFIVIISCSKEDDKTTENFQSFCGEEYELAQGTKCCMEGPERATSDDIITVTYMSNIENALYKWGVTNGSLVLIEGENSSAAKFKVEKNFVRDTIWAESYSPDLVHNCSTILVITAGH